MQRTPDGAAELGCALTPSGPLPSRGLHAQAPRRSLHRGDATVSALTSTAGTEIRRLRAGLRDKARRASSPPCLGRRCGVNCCAIQHNGLLHARPAVVRRLTPAGHARNPRYVLRPAAPARGIGSEYRAHAPPIPRLVRTRGTGCASHGVRRAARAVMVLAPARPPSAPRGGSRALSTVLAQRSAVLAASRVRFAASRP